MLKINQLSSSKFAGAWSPTRPVWKKPVPRCFRWVTGYETSFFKCDREISEDVRPHPGPVKGCGPTGLYAPLPRERENRSPPLSHADMPDFRASMANETESEPVTEIIEIIHRRADAHPLPGGEGRGEGEREL